MTPRPASRRADRRRPGAIARVADQLGVHREALRGWVRQAEIDEGSGPAPRPLTFIGSPSWNARCAAPTSTDGSRGR
ncbi:hypothetical protein B1L11_09815 [Microbispora sp. GKU 823]|nr:hypothetical protein B1L11_09815 [Microbispora sp. GKU 823]